MWRINPKFSGYRVQVGGFIREVRVPNTERAFFSLILTGQILLVLPLRGPQACRASALVQGSDIEGKVKRFLLSASLHVDLGFSRRKSIYMYLYSTLSRLSFICIKPPLFQNTPFICDS